MTDADEKAMLLRYLTRGREAIVWKLDGLSEYDARRPMTATGTNLLGLVKHLASVEFGYFGLAFDRPHGESLPWWDDDAEPNADMWATLEESRSATIELYRRSWAFADATIHELPLDTLGTVPWWAADRAETSLRRIVVHVTEETARHAGHADIVRELIDASAGLSAAVANLAEPEDGAWATHVARLEAVARAAGGVTGS